MNSLLIPDGVADPTVDEDERSDMKIHWTEANRTEDPE